MSSLANLSTYLTTNIQSLSSTSSNEIPTLAASITGLSISLFIFSIASWRLLVHYSGWLSKCGCCINLFRNTSELEENVHIRTEGLTTKRILHVLLWTIMLIEGVAYMDMLVHDKWDKLNYLLLDILGKGILEYSTFSILTVYWFDMTSSARAIVKERLVTFTLFRWVLCITTLGMIGMNTYEAVVLLGNKYSTLAQFQSQSSIHRITLLVECISWGVHAVIVSICGGIVYSRISSLPNFAQVGLRAKSSILSKMLFPIVSCAISYGLRSGWYGADYVSRLHGSETAFETGAAWWICNVWIPSFIPSLCLLYSVRKRDREPGSIDGVSESLLKGDTLGSGGGDPFRNFNRMFRDLDDESAIVSVE